MTGKNLHLTKWKHPENSEITCSLTVKWQVLLTTMHIYNHIVTVNFYLNHINSCFDHLITCNACVWKTAGEKRPPRWTLGNVKVHLCWFLILLNVSPYLKQIWFFKNLYPALICVEKLVSLFTDLTYIFCIDQAADGL